MAKSLWPGRPIRTPGFGLLLSRGSHPSGMTRLAVRTSPFSPEALCFGPDGSVWALGAHYDESGLIQPERGTLQQYDRQGKLIRELLPRSSFANAVNPAHGPGDPAHGPGGRAVLMTLPDRIGILSKSAREWIEVDSAGNLIGRWASPGRRRVTETGSRRPVRSAKSSGMPLRSVPMAMSWLRSGIRPENKSTYWTVPTGSGCL